MSSRTPEPTNPRTIEPTNPRTSGPPNRRKLSYREREELEQLPSRIEALEREQQALAEKIHGADFYKEPGDVITESLARVEAIHDELLRALARWDDLDSRPR